MGELTLLALEAAAAVVALVVDAALGEDEASEEEGELQGPVHQDCDRGTPTEPASWHTPLQSQSFRHIRKLKN